MGKSKESNYRKLMSELLGKALLLALLPIVVEAKDFGIQGHTYPIAEEDVLKVIQKQLAKVDIDKLNNDLKKRTRQYVERPKPVSDISKTKEAREFYYDPTYVLDRDIKDHKDKILHRKGLKINPLDHTNLKEDLIFIDGDDGAQVSYALSYKKEKPTKVILVKGSPITLQRQHKLWIYFDQEGVLTNKFGIGHIPAVVSQEGKMLKIKEIKLSKKND